MYHYFDFRDLSKQTANGLMASLLFQMAQRSPPCRALLREFWSSSNRNIRPDAEELIRALERMLRACGTVFVIIDALDECPETERVDLFPLLKKLAGLGAGMHLLVTSRLEHDIQHQLPRLELSTHAIHLHKAYEHSRTLRSYISTQLGLYHYDDWSEDVKDKARQTLMEGSNGM